MLESSKHLVQENVARVPYQNKSTSYCTVTADLLLYKSKADCALQLPQ